MAGMGEPVSKGVSDQIEARKRIIGKKVGRTNEDLLYLNAKTGWIKLSSSVNTLSPGQVMQLRGGMDASKILGFNTKAGTNILLGGVLAPDRGLREGIDTTGAYNQNAAYNNRKDGTGIRPMPGITSLAVKSKNTYGTLRDAEVRFMCWTLEDFELMEELYLRPGYTVLLEWGHSMYVDNNGALSKDIQTVGNGYFSNGVTMSQLTNTIAKIRKDTNNNYEGMIGYVKNFSWSYTSEGGYDCSVSIISTGEILESIQLRFDPAQRGAVFESADTEKGREQRKSVYHNFIANMASIESTSFDTKAIQACVGPLGDGLAANHLGYFQKVTFDENWWFDSSTPMHWISLRLYLDIFNTKISPVDSTKQKGSPDRVLTRFNTDYDKSSKFLTSPEHFSIDPATCVLTHTVQFNASTVLEVTSPQKTVAPIGDSDDILNIYISLPYLKGVLDGALDENGKLNKSMHDITETILDGINTALGGINDLGLAYDDEDRGGTWHIVDRNNTPEDSSQYPVFTLAGIDSVFTDVGISSKISNEMASQISIAAQGSASGTNEYVENILKWNAGTIDRIKIVKTTIDKGPTAQEVEDAATKKAEEKKRYDDWVVSVKKYFTGFNSYQGYQKEDMEAAKTLHAEWTVKNVVTKYRTQNKSSLPGLVPVELSFKTDGIGGFIIGQAFKIGAGILPRKYQDKFGYIITGVEHAIDSKNRWETSVRTQFYPIDKPSSSEIQAAGEPPGVTAREVANENVGAANNKPSVSPPAELVAAMKRYGITSPAERAHFLAQCAHESGGFAYKKEFASGAAYEGRKDLGNVRSGDGVRFKGRGYIQITGRANYQKYQDYLTKIGSKVNIMTNPETLQSNYFAADSACFWWKYLSRGISSLANAGTLPRNVETVSARVNGRNKKTGLPNGLADRQQKFTKYWATIDKNNAAYT